MPKVTINLNSPWTGIISQDDAQIRYKAVMLAFERLGRQAIAHIEALILEDTATDDRNMRCRLIICDGRDIDLKSTRIQSEFIVWKYDPSVICDVIVRHFWSQVVAQAEFLQRKTKSLEEIPNFTLHLCDKCKTPMTMMNDWTCTACFNGRPMESDWKLTPGNPKPADPGAKKEESTAMILPEKSIPDQPSCPECGHMTVPKGNGSSGYKCLNCRESVPG